MSWYFWVKWLHIVSSTILFGTGIGIAFFFVRAQRTGNVAIIASVGRDVVLADAVFTAAAVIIQPASGMALALMAGYLQPVRAHCRWSTRNIIVGGLLWGGRHSLAFSSFSTYWWRSRDFESLLAARQLSDHPEQRNRRRSGIHGDETVVERQRTTEYENGLAPRGAGA
jgi:hypothetical protein